MGSWSHTQSLGYIVVEKDTLNVENAGIENMENVSTGKTVAIYIICLQHSGNCDHCDYLATKT